MNILSMPVLALEFDTSIDDEIRKNYNPSKIEEDMALPMLPNILNIEEKNNNVSISTPTTTKTLTKTTTIQKTVQKAPVKNIRPQINRTVGKNYAVLKAGTKIRVKLLSGISDHSKKGTKVVFVSKYPVSTTYFTIPSGTIFEGVITGVHKPQLSGNGGLIEINANSMIINNSIQPLTASITKANFKNIFFNKIKGERKYIQSMIKAAKPGCHFFGKMMKVTTNLKNDGSSVILAPFSITAGLIALTSNVAASPVLAMFYKGDTIFLRSGCDIELKLRQDIIIYN